MLNLAHQPSCESYTRPILRSQPIFIFFFNFFALSTNKVLFYYLKKCSNNLFCFVFFFSNFDCLYLQTSALGITKGSKQLATHQMEVKAYKDTDEFLYYLQKVDESIVNNWNFLFSNTYSVNLMPVVRRVSSEKAGYKTFAFSHMTFRITRIHYFLHFLTEKSKWKVTMTMRLEGEKKILNAFFSKSLFSTCRITRSNARVALTLRHEVVLQNHNFIFLMLLI